MRDVEEALSKVPIFRDLKRRDLKRLAALCVPRSFSAGAEILHEGGVGLGLYLISEGRVEVFKTENGNKHRLAVLVAGDVLGEMALIDEKPRSASAVALEPTTTLLLSRDSFNTVLKKSPDVAWGLVPNLAEHLREAQDHLIEVEARADAAERRARAAERRPGDDGGHLEPSSEPETRPSTVGALLYVPYAVTMSSAAGLGGSVRAFRGFARTFAEETGLSRDCGVLHVLRRLPQGVQAATLRAAGEARKIPEEMADAFMDPSDSRDHGDPKDQRGS